jgi:hypothetical protein
MAVHPEQAGAGRQVDLAELGHAGGIVIDGRGVVGSGRAACKTAAQLLGGHIADVKAARARDGGDERGSQGGEKKPLHDILFYIMGRRRRE